MSNHETLPPARRKSWRTAEVRVVPPLPADDTDDTDDKKGVSRATAAKLARVLVLPRASSAPSASSTSSASSAPSASDDAGGPLIIVQAPRSIKPAPTRRTVPPALKWTALLCASIIALIILPLIHLATTPGDLPVQLSFFGAFAQVSGTGTDVVDPCINHTVLAGETLQSLSDDYGVSVAEIASTNNLATDATLKANQRICMPSLGYSTRGQSGNIKANPDKTGSAKGEAAYVAYVLPYARRAHDGTGWPLSLILAQWGLEQGWKTPSFNGYNFGNCGAVPNEPMVDGLNVPGSPTYFAYAATPNDGLRIYLHVAHLAYYSAIAPAAKNGADAAARALGQSPWDAGHYTGDDDPGSSLINVMKAYNLYKYDK